MFIDTDLTQYITDFIAEAQEYLDLMAVSLQDLTSHYEYQTWFNLLRAIHTLKTLSASLNYHHMANLCCLMEKLLENTLDITDYLPAFICCHAFLEKVIQAIKNGQSELDSTVNCQQLEILLNKNKTENAPIALYSNNEKRFFVGS